MTPSYSSDGKRIIYSASIPNENLQQWEQSDNQHIYEVNLENNEIIKLTSSASGWDFYPQYINNDSEFIFIRKDKENKRSLIKGDKDRKEQVIIEGILNEEDYWYYGHYDIEKVFDNMQIIR